jgi:hypothetical protein
LFEVKIKNKPNTLFPKSFSDELGGVRNLDRNQERDEDQDEARGEGRDEGEDESRDEYFDEVCTEDRNEERYDEHRTLSESDEQLSHQLSTPASSPGWASDTGSFHNRRVRLRTRAPVPIPLQVKDWLAFRVAPPTAIVHTLYIGRFMQVICRGRWNVHAAFDCAKVEFFLKRLGAVATSSWLHYAVLGQLRRFAVCRGLHKMTNHESEAWLDLRRCLQRKRAACQRQRHEEANRHAPELAEF